MQFVKHFAPPQKNAASRLEGREQASSSLLGQSVQSGMEVRPSGVEHQRLKAQTNSVHSKKKGKPAWSICWLYGDTAENATASSICRRTPHYLENWCSSQSVDHELLYTSSLLFTQTVKWGGGETQHIFSTAVIKIAKSIPCFGKKAKWSATRGEWRRVDILKDLTAHCASCDEALTPGYLDRTRPAVFMLVLNRTLRVEMVKYGVSLWQSIPDQERMRCYWDLWQMFLPRIVWVEKKRKNVYESMFLR